MKGDDFFISRDINIDIINEVPGVYKITNIINNNCYVGSAQDIYDRWRTGHVNKLRLGIHRNKHLQSAWVKYGEENFKFEVMEYILFSDLDNLHSILYKRENNFIAVFAQHDRPFPAYNNKPDAFTTRGWKMPEEQKKAMRLRQTGKPVHSEAWKKELQKNWSGDLNPIKNPELLAKQKISRRKFFDEIGISEETRQKIREVQTPRFQSQEFKDYIKNLRKERGPFAPRKAVERIDLTTGEVKEYISISSTVIDGFDNRKVSLVCNGQRKTHGGFSWQFLTL